MYTKHTFPAFLLSVIGYAGCCGQDSEFNTVRKVLVTLQEDETIVATESCLPLDVSGEQLFLVTRLGKQFYLYEEGQRNGPYENLENVNLKP